MNRNGVGWVRLLLWLLGLIAFAYFTGRIKTTYYFETFGVDSGLYAPTFGDSLYDSWFVIQNVAFFTLLWWVVLRTRIVWAGVVALLYTMIPLASHYAFAVHEWSAARGLIRYRHTILKLVPFLVLVMVWAFYPRFRATLRELRWPGPPAARVVFAVVVFSWGISTAKHFGSFDANQVLRAPEEYLPRFEPPTGTAELFEEAGRLFLLHAADDDLVLLDGAGFVYGESEEVHLVVVPRDRFPVFQTTRAIRVQHGGQYL